ncbi:MAG: hypothetical protein LGR52_02835 [Candidatus Thiosymbion ectosymbiont of Robbea hypermnestra]|nr:hypothetical protein [Candidatus Thiosymbion ectosymbiont of Robbea hypermnestra]
MSNENNDNEKENTQQELEPDFDAEPPKVTYILDDVTPKSSNTLNEDDE